MIKLNTKAISHNQYYRICHNRYIISKAGREFREKIHAQLSNMKPVDYPIKLSINFKFKDRRKRDLDNLTKAVIDAMKGYLYQDDSQIEELHTYKRLKCDEDCIEIAMKKIPLIIKIKLSGK